MNLPHPITGHLFGSPVAPGTGWPGDPADEHTPVATTPEEVRRLAASSADLAELDARVSVCRACPRLVAWRESVAVTKRASFADQPYWGRPAPSFGVADPRILVIGLAPAANGANRTGRMFTGDESGTGLFAGMHRVGLASQPTSQHAGDGLTLDGVRITAAVRCAPPDNIPTTAEKATCAAWLDRELALVAPGVRVVFTLGGIGWQAALAAMRRAGWQDIPRPKPTFGHGASVPLRTPYGVVTLIGSYHVSQRNTFTGLLTPAMLDEVLTLARDRARSPT